MALQTLSVPQLYPHGPQAIASPYTASPAGTLDGTNDYIAFVTQAVEPMVITHVGWRNTGVVSTVKAVTQIEGVDLNTGFPDGVIKNTGTAKKQSANLVASAWVLYQLDGSATIARGEWFAVKIFYDPSNTPATQTFTLGYGGGARWINQNPYMVVEAGAGPAKSAATNAFPNLALGSSATTFYRLPGFAALSVSAAANVFDNTNGNARGVLFQVPMRCRCSGLSIYTNNATGDFNAAIHTGGAGSATEIGGSSTFVDGSLSAASNGSPIAVMFDNPVELTAGVNYRAIIEAAQSGTNTSIHTYAIPLADAIYRAANPGGMNWQYTSRVSGTWSETPTAIPLVDIIIDQLDDGIAAVGAGAILSRIQGGF